MKIVPLSKLKTSSSAVIERIIEKSGKNGSDNLFNRIYDIGLFPGAEVKIIKRTGRLAVIEIDKSSAWAIESKVSDAVLINAAQNDIFQPKPTIRQKFLATFNSLLSKL